MHIGLMKVYERATGQYAKVTVEGYDVFTYHTDEYVKWLEEYIWRMSRSSNKKIIDDRTALCVNACAGITNKALASGALEFMSEVTVAYFNDNITSRNARDDIKLPPFTKETLTVAGVKVWEVT